jgi:hypothetical protein
LVKTQNTFFSLGHTEVNVDATRSNKYLMCFLKNREKRIKSVGMTISTETFPIVTCNVDISLLCTLTNTMSNDKVDDLDDYEVQLHPHHSSIEMRTVNMPGQHKMFFHNQCNHPILQQVVTFLPVVLRIVFIPLYDCCNVNYLRMYLNN